MRLSKWASLAACAGLWATAGHASIVGSGVFHEGGPGFYETYPIQLPFDYVEAFQLTVTYDKSLFADAKVYLDGNYWLLYRQDLPPPWKNEYEEHGLAWGVDFDVNTPKLVREQNTNAPLVYFQPTSTGFILTAWDAGDPCRTRPAAVELCHEVGKYNFVNLFGHADADQVIPFEYKLDDAPRSMTVPEPATWAMMITGFAAVGAMARRRRAIFAA